MEGILRQMCHYMPGTVLILFGITILLFPFLLVALISSLFILAGIFTLFWAKKLEKLERDPFYEAALWYRQSQWPQRIQRIFIFKE